MSLQDFKDKLSKEVFGRTAPEAQKKSVCVCCGDLVDPLELSDLDWREYEISGLCPKCFEEITR